MSGVFDSISKVCLHYLKHESARKSVVGTVAAELPAAYTSPADFLACSCWMLSGNQEQLSEAKELHDAAVHPLEHSLSCILQAFKKPDPKELVRKWQADLRAEQRKIDRQIRGVSAAEEEPVYQHMTYNVCFHSSL